MLEKLKKELEKTTNPMEKALGEYILSLGREVKEGANLMGCAAKVKEKAKAQASGGCAMVEDAVVYGWAREYRRTGTGNAVPGAEGAGQGQTAKGPGGNGRNLF